MSKIIQYKNGEQTRYHFWCPACNRMHIVTDAWDVDLTTDTISPSVLVNVGHANPNEPICHSFVRKGKIQYLNDCTHKMAGKTVELQDLGGVG